MKKTFKLLILAFSLSIASIISIGFADNYFEIAKNLDIFTTLYKELNTFYVDETDPGDLMKKGIAQSVLGQMTPSKLTAVRYSVASKPTEEKKVAKRPASAAQTTIRRPVPQ